MRTSRWWRLLAVFFAFALVAAACGDDDDGGDEGDDTTQTDDGDTDDGDGDTGDDMDDDMDDMGDDEEAVAADDSLEPVRIGLVNQENSPVGSFPEYRESVEATADYINDTRGGIDGHPIEIVSCVQASVEEAQACDQELGSADLVSVFGGINIFRGDLYTALGDTPVIGGTPLFPADYTAENARYFYGGALTVFGAMAQFVIQELGATNVAILENDNPAGKASGQVAVDQFEAAEVDYTRIDIPSPATDVTPQVTQAASGDFDAVLVLVSAAECGQVIQSANQLEIPRETIVYTGTCNDQATIDEFGDQAVGSYFHTTVITPGSSGTAVEEQQLDEAELLDTITTEYNADGAEGAFATLGIQDMLIVEAVYDSLGFEALSDPANIIDAFDSQEWNVPSGTSLRCGEWKNFPAVCNGDNFFPQLGEGGERVIDRAWNVLDVIGNA